MILPSLVAILINHSFQAQTNDSGKPAPGMKTIGKLGQSNTETKIYSEMDSDSKILWNLNAYQYLVINSTLSEEWLTVVLTNGKNGFILKAHVELFPYTVEIPKNYKFGEKTLESERASRIYPTSNSSKAYLFGSYRTEKKEIEREYKNPTAEEMALLSNTLSFSSQGVFKATISGIDYLGKYTFNPKEHRILISVTHVAGRKSPIKNNVIAFVYTNGKQKFVHIPSIDLWFEKYK